MDLLTAARQRYTAKAYDPAKRIPQDKIDRLLETLRLSPSSVNSQPWHFVVASTAEGKARLAKSATGSFAYNEPKITKSSHVVVFCARTQMTDEHLDAVLRQDEAAGRFPNEEAKAGQRNSRRYYVDVHRYDQKDLQSWMEKQTYIALGTLLLAAGIEGVDATPMEGFDAHVLDIELGLREKGYTSLVLVSLGYHGEDDFNAKLPKSRLAADTVFTQI